MATSEEFRTTLLTAAIKLGALAVEFRVCPHCQAPQHHIHFFQEVLICQVPTCAKQFPSDVVRQPQPGEVTEKHLRLAISTLHDAYKNQQQTTLPAPSREEIAALPVDMQLIVARQSVAASKHVLEKASSLAESFAELRQ